MTFFTLHSKKVKAPASKSPEISSVNIVLRYYLTHSFGDPRTAIIQFEPYIKVREN